METEYEKIFYAGIAYNEYPQKGQSLKKTGLSLRKLEREFPYLLGEGRRKVRKLQVYFTLLPEYAGKTFFGGNPRKWKPETIRRFLDDAWERASIGQGCTEQAAAWYLRRSTDLLPIELWAVRLYQERPFDSICILYEQAVGEEELWQLKELIAPYLPRMKKVVFKGPESEASEILADYLYGEFGIVMTKAENTPTDIPVIDFRVEDGDGGVLQSGRKKMKYISPVETLKFLDIAVKNGYNTKVN